MPSTPSLVDLIRKAINALIAVLRVSTFKRSLPDHGVIFLDITERIRFRTLQQLLIVFQQSEYQVYLRAHLGRQTFSNANGLTWHKNYKLIWGRPSSAGVLCTDNVSQNSRDLRSFARVITLNYEYGPSMKIKPNHFVMPFTMHPQIYLQYGEHKKLDKYRRTQRKIRILFAGGIPKRGDEKQKSSNVKKRLTRWEILEFLQDNNLVRIVATQEELQFLLSDGYWNGFVMIDNSKLRINQKDWMSLVVKADFFLCAPALIYMNQMGGEPPMMCHNAIEAMAVGTIPLINYSDWFFPNLVNLENCVAFDSLEDLHRVFNEILQMSDDQIKNLREKVNDYYKLNLSLDGFINRILQHSESTIQLHVIDLEHLIE